MCIIAYYENNYISKRNFKKRIKNPVQVFSPLFLFYVENSLPKGRKTEYKQEACYSWFALGGTMCPVDLVCWASFIFSDGFLTLSQVKYLLWVQCKDIFHRIFAVSIC